MENKIPRGYAKFRVKLTFNRSQLDWFKSLFDRDATPISEYIKAEIKKAEDIEAN